ncbi:hypothetical protein JY651_46620 [Pyxidicoccus parkwayensis]|uniref:Lipoprotein n=1 Tax=Pyxidicoccus parkwayensis TaxID=2813578 RepID=A0ABX7NYI9_9BACT|nr:hypothetical protein [Pyxidicoccus parkwaysis]QSQ22510.1 hypothetical protein JY651_46620 [Pyxidicoccus parkwaysis]
MNTFLRAVVMAGASLAMAACGGEMTPEEAALAENEALTQSESELGSCNNWSEYNPTGNTFCDYRSCGYTWTCDDWYAKGSNAAAKETPDENILYCENGMPAYRVPNPGTFAETYSYRVCFDQYGNYTHTEYQYSSSLMACGC